MKTLSMGLIGAGRIGRVHARNVVTAVEGCELRAVADVNQEAALACGDLCGVDRIFNSPSGVFEDPHIDAVLICSATDTHADLIEAAARANKHIFCEKPIAPTLEAIDGALEAVDRAGVKLQVGFNRRFDAAFARVAEADVGERHILRITSRDPEPPPIDYVRASGGLFLDMMIHDLDLARFIVKSEVETVFAVGAVKIDPEIGAAGDIDTAMVTLVFADGTLATIDNSRRAPYGYDQRVELLGAKGMVWADNPHLCTTGVATATGFSRPRIKEFFIDRYAQAYLDEMRAFVRSVRDDRTPPVTGADGRSSVVLAMAAERSLRTGAPVRVADIS